MLQHRWTLKILNEAVIKRQILYVWFYVHELAKEVKLIETESRMVEGGAVDQWIFCYKFYKSYLFYHFLKMHAHTYIHCNIIIYPHNN